MLGPVAWRTPPTHYGPWEQVVSVLTEGLIARGVDVTLFATADSVTAARLEAVVPHGYAEDSAMDGRVWEALHVSHALAMSGDFDIVHNHLDWLPLAFGALSRAPMVTTVHGFSDPAILPAYAASSSAFVSVSDADRASALRYEATVYHGVDIAALPFVAVPGGNAVAFGRIHPDKGQAVAIELARAAGMRLIICGPIHDQRYFERDIAPHLADGAVEYRGSVGPNERARMLGNAAVLLHPIDFDEPFGLSVAESMVCGTPVVAYRRGSMAEVVDHGVTGFVATSFDGAVRAIAKARALNRAEVRRVAVARFGSERMVSEYLAVYETLRRRDPSEARARV